MSDTSIYARTAVVSGGRGGSLAVRRHDPPAGVLVIDKPAGMTSFGVVRSVRRALGGAKVGHTGTLDPLATGVLPICIGEATKIAGLLLAEDKIYHATARMGLTTDTLDVTGQIEREADWGSVRRGDVEDLLPAFTGTITQIPPAFSALRKNGRRAHQLARRGEPVVLEPRRVVVHALRFARWRPPFADFYVHCGKGTYVRSLIADLGKQLGCGACLAALRRERSGTFSLRDSVALEQVEQRDVEALPIVSMDVALSHLPAVEIDSEVRLVALRQGQRLRVAGQGADASTVRIRYGEQLVALGAVRDGWLLPRRVFAAQAQRSGNPLTSARS